MCIRDRPGVAHCQERFELERAQHAIKVTFSSLTRMSWTFTDERPNVGPHDADPTFTPATVRTPEPVGGADGLLGLRLTPRSQGRNRQVVADSSDRWDEKPDPTSPVTLMRYPPTREMPLFCSD